MALTNKGSKWENKNSLFLIFAFFPFLDCIPFFHMNARVENKKWKRMGWASVILNVLFLILLIICMIVTVQISYNDSYGLNDYRATAPKIEDYLGADYYEKYGSDYDQQPGYLEYEKDYQVWADSDEIKEASRRVDQVDMFLSYLFTGLQFLWLIIILFFLIAAFIERPKYLRKLAQKGVSSDVIDRISSLNKKSFTNIENERKTSEQNDQLTAIDINSATEEELTKLKGITIIDAKKAIAYREEHGGFSNIDEFFSCINSKPHIIAANEHSLSVGKYSDVSLKKIKSNDKRKIDL